MDRGTPVAGLRDDRRAQPPGGRPSCAVILRHRRYPGRRGERFSKALAGYAASVTGKPAGKFAANQHLKSLLPYQDNLIEKGHELAAKAGTWMAEALATGAQGTGTFLLLLFVILYATFYFLTDGRAILDQSLAVRRFRTRTSCGSGGGFFGSARDSQGELVVGVFQGGLAGLRSGPRESRG